MNSTLTNPGRFPVRRHIYHTRRPRHYLPMHRYGFRVPCMLPNGYPFLRLEEVWKRPRFFIRNISLLANCIKPY
jgi:hypothetical protein